MSNEIEVVKPNVTMNIDLLHIRYIPKLTPINVWKAGAASAMELMSLITSPHVELMTIFRDYGKDWTRIMGGRYVEERRHRRACGMARWTEEYIKYHIHKRWDIFKSIRKHGLDYRKCRRDPIVVLKEAFWKTRFGAVDIWLQDHEIWNGAGRCSAAYVLGHARIKATLSQDKYPGTGNKGKFENKLRQVEGVFDGINNNTIV
jgi:hypothetical protein